MKELLDQWKLLVGALAAIAVVSTFVAGRVAGSAEKKADAVASALEAVAQTQLKLAETQKQLVENQAETRGTLEGVLAGLDLNPGKLEFLLSLPREPRMDTLGRILCGQSWLANSPKLDSPIAPIVAVAAIR